MLKLAITFVPELVSQQNGNCSPEAVKQHDQASERFGASLGRCRNTAAGQAWSQSEFAGLKVNVRFFGMVTKIPQGHLQLAFERNTSPKLLYSISTFT